MTSTLADRIGGPVYEPGDEGFAAAAAGFNLAFDPRPDLVAVATSVDDMVEAVRFARVRRHARLGAGHRARRRDDDRRRACCSSRPASTTCTWTRQTRTATIGAGVRWKAVVNAAAAYGLAAITGSSPMVGAVGYLLGGGIGPLARSHGFSSDYVIGFTVVTGEGEVVEADATPTRTCSGRCAAASSGSAW